MWCDSYGETAIEFMTKERKQAKRILRRQIYSVVLTKGLGVDTRLNCTPAQQRAAARSLTDQFIKQTQMKHHAA